MQFFKKNKILSVTFVIVLFIFIWYFFFSGGGSTSSADVSATGTTSSVPGQDVLNLLQQISIVQINTTLFSGPVWTSLHDFSITLPQNVPGKADLFASFGSLPSNTSH